MTPNWTADRDWLALVRAICAQPDCDTVRLACADWLDDTSSRVPCPACGGRGWRHWYAAGGESGRDDCPTCSGSGTVPDGRAERAEFIRVGIELAIQRDPARRPRASEANDRRQDWLEKRSAELLKAHWSAFVEPCPFGGAVNVQGVHGADANRLMPTYTFSRGFVAAVALPLGVFLVRAGELVLGCPLERVDVTDRTPEPHTWAGGTNWSWYSEGIDTDPATVPDEILRLMPAGLFAETLPFRRAFATEEESRGALSFACIQSARRAAGLPAWTRAT